MSPTISEIRLEPVSENSMILYFADVISAEAAVYIGDTSRFLRSNSDDWLIEVIPSYTSIFIQYDAMLLDFLAAKQKIMSLLGAVPALDPAQTAQGKLIELPACYHPGVAPDLEPAATRLNMGPEELVAIHSSREYRVCAIGFAPGFAFLASVDPRIALPRLSSPRKKVMAGSLGITGEQTAVYPQDSPGGWQIIGNCPVSLFDPGQEPMTPFEVGDRVRFVPITLANYLESGGVSWNGD